MLCGGWWYFLPYIHLGIENPLTRLELHAVPQPHTTAAVSHPLGLHILPGTTCYIHNSVAVEKSFLNSQGLV